jgi:hypothetical protein
MSHLNVGPSGRIRANSERVTLSLLSPIDASTDVAEQETSFTDGGRTRTGRAGAGCRRLSSS